MKAKIKIGALLLAGTLAISAVGVGFAAWQTTITADGSVTASGKWQVEVTNAAVQLSGAGAQLLNGTSYAFERSPELIPSKFGSVISTLSSNQSIPESTLENHATQSEYPMQTGCAIYAIDATKFDWDALIAKGNKKLTWDDYYLIRDDESSIAVRDNLHAYYRMDNIPGETAMKSFQDVYDAFINDFTAVIREKHPDTWTNYMIVNLVPYSSTLAYRVATLSQTEVAPETVISANKSTASFANVGFSLPGAWANYTLTITNNGTADAYLRDAVISLEGDCDQLVLDKPDFTDEVLKAGESCTFNVVVKVADIEENELSANAVLTITLPYGQITVEEAPSAGHTHG